MATKGTKRNTKTVRIQTFNSQRLWTALRPTKQGGVGGSILFKASIRHEIQPTKPSFSNRECVILSLKDKIGRSVLYCPPRGKPQLASTKKFSVFCTGSLIIRIFLITYNVLQHYFDERCSHESWSSLLTSMKSIYFFNSIWLNYSFFLRVL